MNKGQQIESAFYPCSCGKASCGKELTTLQYAPSEECAIAPHRNDQIGHERMLVLVAMLNKAWEK